MRMLQMLALVSSLLFAGFAFAQEQPSMYGFGYGSLGGFSDGGSLMTHFGGGVQWTFDKSVGFGAEFGYLTPAKYFSEGIGTVDLNGNYYFSTASWKFVPFVTGGYTLGFREAAGNFVNFGGGFNYWTSSHFGLRTEFRDYIPFGGGWQYYDVRFGIVFH